MNLGKIKNFLIVLFLGINIYLIFSLAASLSFHIDDKTIENTVEVLNSAKIGIDKSVIPKKLTNLKNVETRNVIYTNRFKNIRYYKDFELANDTFSAEFKNTEIYNKNNKAMIKDIKKHLSACGFDTDFMRFSDIKAKDGKKTFTVNCYVQKYCFFDSSIKVAVDKNGYSISGKWYNPQSKDVTSNSKSREMVYITSVLIDLKENEQIKNSVPVTINNIEYGYLSDSMYGTTGHVSATALPYYKITDNNNNVYYYDATDGTYNNKK